MIGFKMNENLHMIFKRLDTTGDLEYNKDTLTSCRMTFVYGNDFEKDSLYEFSQSKSTEQSPSLEFEDQTVSQVVIQTPCIFWYMKVSYLAHNTRHLFLS
jgi:hypothetical protein